MPIVLTKKVLNKTIGRQDDESSESSDDHARNEDEDDAADSEATAHLLEAELDGVVSAPRLAGVRDRGGLLDAVGGGEPVAEAAAAVALRVVMELGVGAVLETQPAPLVLAGDAAHVVAATVLLGGLTAARARLGLLGLPVEVAPEGDLVVQMLHAGARGP